MEDEELIEQIRAGGKDAKAAEMTFFNRWYPRLVRYGERLGMQSADAEDYAAKLLMYAWFHYDPTLGPFAPYVWHLALMRAHDWFRSQSRRLPTTGIETLDFAIPKITELSPTVERDLNEGFAQLTERERMVFILRFLGFTNAEIAQMLSLKEGNVSTIYSRACQQFREHLGERGYYLVEPENVPRHAETILRFADEWLIYNPDEDRRNHK